MVWDGDAKAVQQCLTDIFTSVYTTCDIPENAIFGPCVLSHTSLYDSIAFVALKSTDKRTAPYIFRVSAPRPSQPRWAPMFHAASAFYFKRAAGNFIDLDPTLLRIIFLFFFCKKNVVN